MNASDNFRDRALRFFPGGSNGEYGIPEGDAPVIERGRGCRVWDTGGREYLDMTMAWGAALVGHAHPKVLEAASAAAANGANFAAVNRPMVELAERIADLSPCVERIRFVASGTEATMLCLRTARAATGRAKILKFEGAYHGQHPEGVTSLVGSDPPALPQPDPAGTGAPWVERDVLVAPYNDLAATEQILTDHAADLAAVIVEPLHRRGKEVSEAMSALTRLRYGLLKERYTLFDLCAGNGLVGALAAAVLILLRIKVMVAADRVAAAQIWLPPLVGVMSGLFVTYLGLLASIATTGMLLAGLIADIAEAGDYVLCLGAGSITQWANELPGRLEREIAQRPAPRSGAGA